MFNFCRPLGTNDLLCMNHSWSNKTFNKFILTVFKTLSFANSWFGVVTTDIVEPDSVIVKVVQNCKTELIALTVIWLRNSKTEKKFGLLYFNTINYLKLQNLNLKYSPSSVGEQTSELVHILADAVRPGDGLSANPTSGPKPFLTFSGTQVHELLGKGGIVERDGSHSAAGTGSLNLGCFILSSASSPRHPKASSSRLVVDSRCATAGRPEGTLL